jgi:hypothetical protein
MFAAPMVVYLERQDKAEFVMLGITNSRPRA